MKAPWRRPVTLVATAALALVAANAASSATLPNPCTLLGKVHPERTLARGQSVVVSRGKLTSHGTGNQAFSTCSETIGAQPLNLTFSYAFGGFGGLQVTSMTHPTGLGAGDKLVVGKSPSGGPVDFIVFHKATVYVYLSANGANPTSLTTLARQLYRLLP